MAQLACALVISAAEPAHHFPTVAALAEHVLEAAGRRQLVLKPVTLSIARIGEDVHSAAAIGVHTVLDGAQELLGYALVGLPPKAQGVQRDLLKAALLDARKDLGAAA